jgi:hypothetical protein
VVKTVQDVDGGLADPARGEEVFDDIVAEQHHELAAVESWDWFKAAVGGPNTPAGDGVDMRMSCEALRNVKQPAFETAKPPPVKPFC